MAVIVGEALAVVNRTDGAVLVAVLPILVVLQPTNTLSEQLDGAEGAVGRVETWLPLVTDVVGLPVV